MARTSIAVTEVGFTSSSNVFNGIQNVSFAAADSSNGMSFDNDGGSVLMVRNTSGSAVTVTVGAAVDEAGRLVNMALTCPALSASNPGLSFVGPLKQRWWNQSGGVVNVDFSASSSVTVAVLRLKQG